MTGGDEEAGGVAAATVTAALHHHHHPEQLEEEEENEEIVLLRAHPLHAGVHRPIINQLPPTRPKPPRHNNPYQRPCPRPLLLLLAGVGAGLCLALRGMAWSSSSSASGASTEIGDAGGSSLSLPPPDQQAQQQPQPPLIPPPEQQQQQHQEETVEQQAIAELEGREGCIASQPIPLWAEGGVPLELGTDPVKDTPTLTAFLPPAARSSGASAVIMPGGGYKFLSEEKEGTDYAEWLCREEGVAAYVLKYRLGPDGYHHPAQLLDAQRALRTVRSRLREGVDDPARVGVVGSSAGGHLSATVAAYHDAGDASALDPVDRFSSRPDFAVLVYPVISFDPSITHKGSRDNIIGPPPPPATAAFSKEEKQRVAALTAYYSIEQHVTAPPQGQEQAGTTGPLSPEKQQQQQQQQQQQPPPVVAPPAPSPESEKQPPPPPPPAKSPSSPFPPTFLYHAKDDHTVPYQNSNRLAHALQAAEVPYALCIFESGLHGGGLYGRREGKPATGAGAHGPPKHKWSDLALRFLRREGILPPTPSESAGETEKGEKFVGGPYSCTGSTGDEREWRE